MSAEEARPDQVHIVRGRSWADTSPSDQWALVRAARAMAFRSGAEITDGIPTEKLLTGDGVGWVLTWEIRYEGAGS